MKRPEVKELSEQCGQWRKTPSAIGLLVKDDTGLRKEALSDGSLRGTRCEGSHLERDTVSMGLRCSRREHWKTANWSGKATARGVKAALPIRQSRIDCTPAYRSNPKVIAVCFIANLGEPSELPETMK